MPPFERTVCACPTCVECCYRQPGPLVPGDFERIQKYLKADMAEMRKLFWRSPGALVREIRTGRTFMIGSITPKRVAGKCVFLGPDDRCEIHAVAPAGCRLFDTHMSDEEGQKRSNWVARSQQDGRYQTLRDNLPVATSYNPRKA
jgi:Fe-S-cluster containining protein